MPGNAVGPAAYNGISNQYYQISNFGSCRVYIDQEMIGKKVKLRVLAGYTVTPQSASIIFYNANGGNVWTLYNSFPTYESGVWIANGEYVIRAGSKYIEFAIGGSRPWMNIYEISVPAQ